MTCKRVKSTMSRILVTYATRAGSTKEVSEFIGRVLSEHQVRADVQPVTSVKSLDGYDGVIVGSAIRTGHLMPEALNFVKRNQGKLHNLPTAYFVVCLTMEKDTPEHRQEVDAYMNPLTALVQPVSKGLFAGALDSTKLGFPWKTLMKSAPQGDFRRWDEIRTWAEQAIPLLTKLERA